MDITQYLLANIYSAFSPIASTAAVCSVNGEIVAFGICTYYDCLCLENIQ